MNYNILKKKAFKLRQDTFRKFVEKGEAHLGGSFSLIEISIALFEKIIKKDDKFILSKSHASFPISILLREKGVNAPFTTHFEINPKNGIHCTTGSLGHGLPIATGMAFSKKISKNNNKIYVLISDGECQEGTTWESLLIASKFKLSNLTIIIDYNKIQALTTLKDGLPLHNLKKKILSFNCECVEVKNGHSFKALMKAFKKSSKNKPKVIIAHTIKGKGIKEFENDPVWHARKIQGKEAEIGKKRLNIK